VTDRVICQAIQQVLTPIFDPGFSESSFGFRPGRSAHGALRQLQSRIRAGFRVAVDLDLDKFFDRVDPDVLMARVARKVRDKHLLTLIGRYLRREFWSETSSRRRRWGPRKGPRFRRCSPTSCWTTSTRSWNDAATASSATPTIS
jgi:retron-type reverse transcriptase